VKCPKCGFEDTKVLESRLSNEGRAVRRRRNCIQCNHRFTTYEKEELFAFSVVKKDGRIEPFIKEKSFRAIQTACQKRPINYDQMDAIIHRVERTIQEESERNVPSTRIGDLIMQELYNIDKVAYVRFASVYKDFKDPSEFTKEISSLEKK
jgi:transcriptional repressor NrdR